MADKPNVLVTPIATVSGWVNILRPDTKYNAAGDYKIKVKVPKGARGFTAQLEAIAEAQAKAKAEWLRDPKNKGKRPPQDASLPFYEDEDGNVVINFKSVASWVDKKTGETKNRVIPVFGGAGRIDPKAVPQFGEGSEVRVAYTISGFCNAAVGAGVSLRLDSVKLLTVKQFSGSSTNHFGEEDEGGYVPEAASADNDPYANDDIPDDAGSAGPDDF